MNNAMSALKVLENKIPKYDIVYVNTPWSTVPVDQLKNISVADITEENAALFVWTDAYAVADTIDLVKAWGFKFHSVFQTMDVGTYPWMAPKNDDNKKTRKPRAPPIADPVWWSTPPELDNAPTRPTTESLLLATKGDPSPHFNKTTTAFSVLNMPELGKKSRAKKNGDPSMCSDRPLQFLENVLGHLTPDAKVLNLFSSNIHDRADSWGPAVPGGFLTGFGKNTGLVGKINQAMLTMKKSQLKALGHVSKQSKGDPLAKTLSVMESFKGPMVYELRDGAGVINEWVYSLTCILARKNLEKLDSARKKRKVRQSSGETSRPRHGIACASVVSKELAEFLGIGPDEKIARTTVVSKLNEYITTHGLQNPEHKIEVLLDEPLRKLLNPPEDFGKVTYFNLCKLVGSHFPKKKQADAK
ncbi:putative adenine methyltransferase [Feldmannia species virus]|uniref:DNA adenine methyltranferase n=1 Tax=Feldmannia species virus TaxID=39420 RepID=Q1ZZT1_9PHYC|nr:putative adenine methyltransferase [Feldmannia species virus]ABD73007.1 DNA adenine methyltranferase [Feldmannia species virus]ACH46789.1 putative adenine methyltransferase [Feldmannia species virus]